MLECPSIHVVRWLVTYSSSSRSSCVQKPATGASENTGHTNECSGPCDTLWMTALWDGTRMFFQVSLTAASWLRLPIRDKSSCFLHEVCQYQCSFASNPGNTTPSCTCRDWMAWRIPCKHFFAVFQYYPSWNWERLPESYKKLDASLPQWPHTSQMMPPKSAMAAPSSLCYGMSHAPPATPGITSRCAV